MTRYALLLIPSLAFGAGAWERANLPGGAYWEYDKASIIMLPNDQRRILARLTLSGMAPDVKAGNHYDHAVMLIELDCGKRLMRVVDTVAYLRAERVQPSRTSEDWKAADANVLFKAACHP